MGPTWKNNGVQFIIGYLVGLSSLISSLYYGLSFMSFSFLHYIQQATLIEAYGNLLVHLTDRWTVCKVTYQFCI